MRSLHPASLILLGFAFMLAASSRSGTLLLLPCVAATGLALGRARPHFASILRRSRWLLLTMLVLFGWMTPGTPVPGLPGATHEGLLLAMDNLARLLIAIAVVALLMGALAPPALVSGLRTLLAPLALMGDLRDRLAVRLMLTLQEVEASRQAASRPLPVTDSLFLPVVAPGPVDYLAILGSAAMILFAAVA